MPFPSTLYQPKYSILNEAGQFRFGSKADMAARLRNVRFTPETGHRQTTYSGPLGAKTGNDGAIRSLRPRGRVAVQGR
jgi:hypothetical protein